MRERGYRDEQIVVFGFSLGSSPAVYASAMYPDLQKVIVVGGFSTFTDACLLLAPQLCSLIPDSFLDTEPFAATSQAPIEQYHGDNDQIVDISLGRKLNDFITGPNTFTVFPGGHSEFNIVELITQ